MTTTPPTANTSLSRVPKCIHLKDGRRERSSGEDIEPELHATQHCQADGHRKIRLPQEEGQGVIVPRVKLQREGGTVEETKKKLSPFSSRLV